MSVTDYIYMAHIDLKKKKKNISPKLPVQPEDVQRL